MTEHTTSESPTPVPPRENVLRGALVSLIVIPVGIAAWVLIWNFGYIAAIVAFGVALLALWLYRIGARGFSFKGAIVVTLVTAVTLLLAFVAGIISDTVNAVADAVGAGWVEVITAASFWEFFVEVFPEAVSLYSTEFLAAMGLGALGCFAVLRSAFSSAKRDAAAAEEQGYVQPEVASTDAVAAAEAPVADGETEVR